MQGIGNALQPSIGPHLPHGMTIAPAAYRPWYLGWSELEQLAARKRNQPSPGIAGGDVNRFAINGVGAGGDPKQEAGQEEGRKVVSAEHVSNSSRVARLRRS
jgi:hypothetical protein